MLLLWGPRERNSSGLTLRSPLAAVAPWREFRARLGISVRAARPGARPTGAPASPRAQKQLQPGNVNSAQQEVKGLVPTARPSLLILPFPPPGPGSLTCKDRGDFRRPPLLSSELFLKSFEVSDPLGKIQPLQQTKGYFCPVNLTALTHWDCDVFCHFYVFKVTRFVLIPAHKGQGLTAQPTQGSVPPPQEQSGPSTVTGWDGQVCTVLWQNLLTDKLLACHQPLTLLSLYWVAIAKAALVPRVQVNATHQMKEGVALPESDGSAPSRPFISHSDARSDFSLP